MNNVASAMTTARNYILSPELHRNLWLEFSRAKLVLTPVLLLIIFYLQWDDGGTSYIRMAGFALFLFYISVGIYGSHLAATAMHDEVRNNTWDFQRMSSISPAQYAFGKLFGATSYAWYCAVLCWLVYSFAFLSIPKPEEVIPILSQVPGGIIQQLAPPEPPSRLDDYFYITIFMFLSGVAGQVAAFFSSCRSFSRLFRMRGIARWRASLGSTVFGIVVSGTVYTMLAHPAAESLLQGFGALGGMFGRIPESEWYGIKLSALSVMVFSVVFFTAWGLVGLYRLIKKELLYRMMPLVWPTFVLASFVFLGGFFHDDGAAGPRLLTIVGLALTYAVMMGDATDSDRYRRLAVAMAAGDRRRAFENAPLWSVTLPFAVLALVLFLAVKSSVQPEFNATKSLLGYIAVFLFILRDGIVLHAIHWRFRYNHARYAVVVYYLAAYILLPLLFRHGISGSDFEFLIEDKDAKGGGMLGFFVPTPDGVGKIALECGLAGYILWRLVTDKKV